MADFDEDTPNELVFEDQVFEVAFSPVNDVVASGLVSGVVHVHQYSPSGNTSRLVLNHHEKACRALQFSADGTALITASRDKSMHMTDLNTGTVIHKLENAHADPLNKLCLLEDGLLASGDDEGCVKVWDLRSQKLVMEYEDCEDFISDMVYDSNRKTLLTTSGDGTLCVFNMRKKELVKRSDFMDEELLSLCVMKGGSKVVCGTQDGVLDIFSWGQWGDLSDRFVGHPMSVDTVVALNSDLMCTGSSDGLIRVISVHPNKLLGVVGEHQDFPIERIRLSHDNTYLGSCSHDKTVKFWNVASLVNETTTEGEGEEEEKEGMEEDNHEKGMEMDDESSTSEKQFGRKEENFFSDL